MTGGVVGMGRAVILFCKLLNDFPLLWASTTVHLVVGVAWGPIMGKNQIVI